MGLKKLDRFVEHLDCVFLLSLMSKNKNAARVSKISLKKKLRI
jgi:hypothetical protein